MTDFDLAAYGGIAPAHGDRFEIHHINVGCGDCTLLLIKNGDTVLRSVLIDSGRQGSGLPGYLADKLGAYRDGSGKIVIDCMVVSHYHIDHLGGLFDIHGAVHVKSHMDADYFWDRKADGVPAENRTFPKDTEYTDAFSKAVISMMHLKADSPHVYINGLSDLLTDSGAVRIPLTWHDLPHNILIGTVEKTPILMTCVCGNGCVAGDGRSIAYGLKDRNGNDAPPNNLNDISLGFVIHGGDEFTYFTGGDLSGNNGVAATGTARNMETAVARSVGRPVTAAKIDHHGSRTSTNSDFLGTLRPDALFCFPFYMSKCNLPTADVLNRIKEIGISKVGFTGWPYYQNRFSNIEENLGGIFDAYLAAFKRFKILWDITTRIPGEICRESSLSSETLLNVSAHVDALRGDPMKSLLLGNCDLSRQRSPQFKNFIFSCNSSLGSYAIDKEVYNFINGTEALPAHVDNVQLSLCDEADHRAIPFRDLLFWMAVEDSGDHHKDEEFALLSRLADKMNQPDVLDDYLDNIDHGLYSAVSPMKRRLCDAIDRYQKLFNSYLIVTLTTQFTPGYDPKHPESLDEYYGRLAAVVLVYPRGIYPGPIFRTGRLDACAVRKM
jgi:hypothetical protein